MAYQYKGPSLAAGGKLVKKGQRTRRTTVSQETTSTKSIFTPEQWAERLAPGWDERGWHGGGMCDCRSRQKTRPAKGNSRTGRYAHPSLLKVTLGKNSK